MPYQFLNPSTVLADLLGLEPNTNGFVHFYELGTTSEKDTWSDFEMTTANANPLQLDPDGRFPNAVWLDGDYTIAVADSLDAVIKTFDMRPEVASSLELPAHEAGKFLASDGANWILVDISEQLLPDPTGSTSHYLTTNGSGWQISPIPSNSPEVEITEAAPNYSVRTGTSASDTKALFQWGSATAPASGSESTTASIVFPTAFKSGTTPFVTVQPYSNSQPNGPTVGELTSTPTATGFTARFDVAEGDGSGSSTMVNAVPFGWYAVGVVEVDP